MIGKAFSAWLPYPSVAAAEQSCDETGFAVCALCLLTCSEKILLSQTPRQP